MGALTLLLTWGSAFLNTPGTHALAQGKGGGPKQPPQKSEVVAPHYNWKADLAVADVIPDYKWNGSKMVRVNDCLWVEVINRGTAAANPSALLFEWSLCDSKEQGLYYIPKIQPGEAYWLKVTSLGFNPYTKVYEDYDLWQPGAYWDIVVDCTNTVNETDETNNFTSILYFP